jgi:uncharacterized membrane protein YozB (DUF420 family)
MSTEPGFLNTGASLLADLTLVAYIVLILPALVIGLFFARRKMFEPHHKVVMTAITLFNWVLIIFVMAASYSQHVKPQIPENLGQPVYLIPTIHAITGGLAQLLATYLVLRMWFEKSLPSWFKVQNIKLFMRATLALWLITTLLGVALYITWYTGGEPAGDEVPPPVATEEAAAPVDADSS